MQNLAEHLEVHAKPQFQATFIDIIITHPYQWIIKFRIDGLDIFGGQFLVQHSLVEWHCEARIDEFRMEQCDRNETTDKFEILQMIWIHIAGRIDLQTIIVFVCIFEKAIHGI